MPKKLTTAIIAFVFCAPVLVLGNGLNLNGLGARAAAMGGAFVGVADDFSAVFWNPAGAAGFLRPTFGFSATDIMPKGAYRRFELVPEPIVDAKTKPSHYLGGLLAFYRPISSKIVIGLGLSTPSGIGASWKSQDFAPLSGGLLYDWTSKVGVIAIQPLVAVKLSDAVSLGATVNFNYGMLSLSMPAGEADMGDPPAPVDLGQYEEAMHGWGFGATFGVLVSPVRNFKIGLTLRTASAVKLKGKADISNLAMNLLPGTSDLTRNITWPLWIAGGVSFRPVSRLLLSADVQWTRWSRLERLETDYAEEDWTDLTQTLGMNVRALDWKDATQLRFGAEYTLGPSFALRAGFYHDPSPAPDSTLHVLLPSFTFNALTLGVGYGLGDLRLDFGLEYLMGRDRGLENPYFGTWTWMPGQYGMNILIPNLSINYRF